MLIPGADYFFYGSRQIFCLFCPLPCACLGKLVAGVSLLYVSLSLAIGRNESALYCSKAHMDDNENATYRVNELFECVKSQASSTAFLAYV